MTIRTDDGPQMNESINQSGDDDDVNIGISEQKMPKSLQQAFRQTN